MWPFDGFHFTSDDDNKVSQKKMTAEWLRARGRFGSCRAPVSSIALVLAAA